MTKDIDVWDVVPMISHSDSDPGRTLGAGTTVVRGKHFWGGSHIGYNRMNFRGPDYSSFQISPGSHMDQVATALVPQGADPGHDQHRDPADLHDDGGLGLHLRDPAPGLRRARRGRARSRAIRSSWSGPGRRTPGRSPTPSTSSRATSTRPRRCGRARSPRRTTRRGCIPSTRSGRATWASPTARTNSRRPPSPTGPTARSTTGSSSTAWTSTSSTASCARRAFSSWPSGSCRACASTRTSRWG